MLRLRSRAGVQLMYNSLRFPILLFIILILLSGCAQSSLSSPTTPTGLTANLFKEFALPTAKSHPGKIVLGPDGNLWFTEPAVDQIGRISPAGVITEFRVPTRSGGPAGIASGPDGTLWFTEASVSKIGSITPNLSSARSLAVVSELMGESI